MPSTRMEALIQYAPFGLMTLRINLPPDATA